MLFVKFYVSTFLLCNIYCKEYLIMFMLLLHISRSCDIINTHLFESYPKTDKIHGQGRPADTIHHHGLYAATTPWPTQNKTT